MPCPRTRLSSSASPSFVPLLLTVAFPIFPPSSDVLLPHPPSRHPMDPRVNSLAEFRSSPTAGDRYCPCRKAISSLFSHDLLFPIRYCTFLPPPVEPSQLKTDRPGPGSKCAANFSLFLPPSTFNWALIFSPENPFRSKGHLGCFPKCRVPVTRCRPQDVP